MKQAEGMTELPEMRIDHLGVAVKSIAQARAFYEALGLQVTQEETVEHEQVKTAMLPLGESRIELLEPTGEDSAVGRFLARRGEGLHHVALQVENIEATMQRLKERGVRLISEQVQVGAGGHLYFFVHPASAGGVLLEIVQPAAAREAARA
jgi:methylmalonyl-CoA epimerase